MEKKLRFREVIFPVLILIIFWFLVDENGPCYGYTTYSDTTIWYNYGKMLLDGNRPFVDFFEIKGPYVFFLGALSYLFAENFWLFFILDLISVFICFYFSYRILSIKIEKHKAIWLALIPITSIFCICSFLYPFVVTEQGETISFGNIETLSLGIISMFLYWILDDEFKNKKWVYALFGLYASFLLMTKVHYLLPFGLVAIYWFYSQLKNEDKKLLLKKITVFFIFFLIGCTPMLIFDLQFTDFQSSLLNSIKLYWGYTGAFPTKGLKEWHGYVFFIVVLIIFISLIFISIKDLRKEKKYITLFILGIIFSINITGTVLFYYLYMLVPLSVFLVSMVETSKMKQRYKIAILLTIYIVSVFVGITTVHKKHIFDSKENFYSYQFYQDYKDKIDNDDKIISLLWINNIVTTYFDKTQPNYKYAINLNVSDSNYEYIYEDIFAKLKNKEFKYVSILTNEDGSTIFYQNNVSHEMREKILQAIFENYNLDKRYKHNIEGIYVSIFALNEQ